MIKITINGETCWKLGTDRCAQYQGKTVEAMYICGMMLHVEDDRCNCIDDQWSNVFETCVPDVRIDARIVQYRGEMRPMLPLPVHRQFITCRPSTNTHQKYNFKKEEIHFHKGRNTLLKGKKYKIREKNVYHLLALSPHFLFFQKRRNMNNWAHPHPRHPVLGNASDTMVSWTVEAVRSLKRDRLLVENLLLS